MEKFNSSLFSKRYEGYNLEKEICVINRGIIENDIYALDFLREANYTYNKDKKYFYSLYKTLETSNNCGIYLILTAILLKNEDDKANLKIADKNKPTYQDLKETINEAINMIYSLFTCEDTPPENIICPHYQICEDTKEALLDILERNNEDED